MDCLHDADRRSLLMEVQVLHAQMNSMKITQRENKKLIQKAKVI